MHGGDVLIACESFARNICRFTRAARRNDEKQDVGREMGRHGGGRRLPSVESQERKGAERDLGGSNLACVDLAGAPK
uniref:Uncharacterized protein n=1 Tax=Oryza rufipogon TaxID=4529 RepID=A0A0E0MRV5_ORYRU